MSIVHTLPDACLILDGEGEQVRPMELATGGALLTPANERCVVNAVSLGEGPHETECVRLTFANARVLLPADVAVLNRMRYELHTSEELDWVRAGSLAVGDLVGMFAPHGPGSLEPLVGDYSYESAHHVVWVELRQTERVVWTDRMVIIDAEAETLVVNGLCVHV